MKIENREKLASLRSQIDEVDREVVALLARRTAIVREVMCLKGDEEAVRSPARVEEVVVRVRRLAVAAGMPPTVAEATYRAMITSLTAMQMEHLRIRLRTVA